ncbi:phage holin family protein [Streptomyces sp. NPDC093085]|uniref:phage holin family protein n=1 Tax=Streptomyces sp. NPDC093085 TaxID=3155068 RepID=UPI003437A028
MGEGRGRGRWRTTGRALLRVIVVWAVSTVTMLVLAGVLPDFQLQSADGDSFTRIAVTAAWGAGVFGLLGALVWPLLVRALLLVPALVLGLLVFFLNGSLLLVALRLIPDGRGAADPRTAVVVAAVMSAVASATSTALAVGDDDAVRRRLSRLAGRGRRGRRGRGGRDGGGPEEAPGTVFLQLDGVGHQVLLDAVAAGSVPHLAGWLGEHPTHRLTPWRTDWSSQTGASQLGILHGSNHDVPAFRWYEKESGRVMVSNRPASAAELQRRAIERTGDGGLLTFDGASRGNLFSGGADQLALVLSIAARRGRANRSRAGYFAYFSDPANAVRTALSFAADVCREIGQSTRARIRGDRPRVSRGGLYPFIRAFATVVERDVVVTAVLGDMLAGRTAVYADLVAYDEVAHHSGPRSRDAARVLTRLDRAVGLIARAAEHAPRPYRIVLLSDHGQSPGETFEGAYGLTLKDLVLAGCGLPLSRRARRTRSGAEARDAARHAVLGPVRAALNRPEPAEPNDAYEAAERGVPARGVRERTAPGAGAPERTEGATGAPEPTAPAAGAVGSGARAAGAEPAPARAPAPVVLASGNLGLISFPDLPGRASREEIDRRHPALLRTLAAHPGIGFLLVRSEEHGSVVLGPGGAEVPVAELADDGPLAAMGPGAADAVRRADTFPHVADVMVNSTCDPATGRVHAFEAQIGSHGGLGGDQGRPFLLSPLVLSAPVEDGGELVGAERVHTVLRRWLREAGGPQVPLPPPGATALAEGPAEANVFSAGARTTENERDPA